jgi:hypothetical protein
MTYGIAVIGVRAGVVARILQAKQRARSLLCGTPLICSICSVIYFPLGRILLILLLTAIGTVLGSMVCAKEMLLRAEMTGRMAAKYMVADDVRWKCLCAVEFPEITAKMLVNWKLKIAIMMLSGMLHLPDLCVAELGEQGRLNEKSGITMRSAVLFTAKDKEKWRRRSSNKNDRKRLEKAETGASVAEVNWECGFSSPPKDEERQDGSPYILSARARRVSSLDSYCI